MKSFLNNIISKSNLNNIIRHFQLLKLVLYFISVNKAYTIEANEFVEKNGYANHTNQNGVMPVETHVTEDKHDSHSYVNMGAEHN